MTYSLAIIANYFGLVLSIWLGVYIVTRSRRSWLAWCSGLTLWCLATLFANILLFMFSSPPPFDQPSWAHAILPVWPQKSEGNYTSWTQAWASGLGLFFWYVTTLLVLPGKWSRWRVWTLYLGAVFGILALLVQVFAPNLVNMGTKDPLLVDNQSFTSPYPIFVAFFWLLCGLSVYNLLEAKRLSTTFIAKRQNNMLLATAVINCLAAVLVVIGAIPGERIPVFWVSSLLIFSIAFFGVAVIRYSAVLGQRILWRDLTYSAVAIGLALTVYLALFAWLVRTYHVPPAIFVFIIPLVVLSHSLVEEVRQVLERLIYDQRTRTLRSNLTRLRQVADEQADLSALLSRALQTICYTVRATYGVILIFEQDKAIPTGFFHWHDGRQHWLRKDFEADDVKPLNPGSLPEPFLETTLLIPLYASQEQIGVLLLGRPENGIHYSREDVLVLEGSIDRLVGLIQKNRRINEYLDTVAQLPLQPAEPHAEIIPIDWVEDALQNICDYAYLGGSPLAHLKQVTTLLNGGSTTHLDAGKAVHQVVSGAVEKLHPDAALPHEPIPREWFAYLILHDAYFKGLPNRDITSKLYISEGTFHRTRRSAIRSVTRVLSELEGAYK